MRAGEKRSLILSPRRLAEQTWTRSRRAESASTLSSSMTPPSLSPANTSIMKIASSPGSKRAGRVRSAATHWFRNRASRVTAKRDTEDNKHRPPVRLLRGPIRVESARARRLPLRRTRSEEMVRCRHRPVRRCRLDPRRRRSPMSKAGPPFREAGSGLQEAERWTTELRRSRTR